jgi:hypothetical protein
MGTSIVTQITGEPGIDMSYARFAVITVKEDGAHNVLGKALAHVSMASLQDGLQGIDEIEMRASISSELKAAGLQMTGLQVCGFTWLGE